MQTRIDLLITNAAQVCTIPAQDGGPQRGGALGKLGMIESGAVAMNQGKIVAVGASSDLEKQYAAADTINATGQVVIPGFVDPHTHLVWAGDRAAEFEMRIAGATYMEIMAAGGGINHTVSHVRQAPVDELVEATRPRLDRMLRLGTTTAEVKTGYGLDTANEIKSLEAIYRLDAEHPMALVPTFLGAHAVPPEYKGRTDAYVDLVIDEMTPAVVEFAQVRKQPLPFIDVFCEEGVFDVPQSRRILEAGRAAGMPLKIHADEFKGLGGTRLAVELGAVSADHLVTTPEEDIKALGRGNTIAVGLPGTPFGHHRRRGSVGAGNRLQPRHQVVRVDAVHHGAGLPRHAPDASPGAGRLNAQRRLRRWARGSGGQLGARQASGCAHPRRPRLSAPRLSVWRQLGEDGDQGGAGGRGGVDTMRAGAVLRPRQVGAVAGKAAMRYRDYPAARRRSPALRSPARTGPPGCAPPGGAPPSGLKGCVQSDA